MNPVKELLAKLATDCDDIRIYYKGATHRFGDDDCPATAGLAFVREQLKALQDTLKEAKGGE